MSKICLVIIYNHNFEKNIEPLQHIYKGRFSAIYHVMPFYRGDDPSVIGVYECSYQYSGYVAQAAKTFARKDFTHYVFVADDMILNPLLNENNIVEKLGVGPDGGFVTQCKVMTNNNFLEWRGWAIPSLLNMNSQSNATQWREFMPNIALAREKFERLGLKSREMVSCSCFSYFTKGLLTCDEQPYSMKLTFWKKIMAWFYMMKSRNATCIEDDNPLYPLAFAPGCADFFIVPQEASEEFFYQCGVFAAMRVFVEVAIPTSLALTCKKVVTIDDCKFKSDPPGDNGIRLSADLEQRYGRSYKSLVDDFPSEYLYIHPIKLSKWKDIQ